MGPPVVHCSPLWWQSGLICKKWARFDGPGTHTLSSDNPQEVLPAAHDSSYTLQTRRYKKDFP